MQLLKSCIRKIKVNCKNYRPVVIKILYDVCKIEFFCNTKDRTPIINQSFVVYEFTYPGFVRTYAGKTERTLYERNVEHSWRDQNSFVKNHLDHCVEVQYLLNITSLGPALFLNDNNIGSANNNLAIDNTKQVIATKMLTLFCLKKL